MKIKNGGMEYALLLTLLMLPGLSGAACTQADLRGTWYATGVDGDIYNYALSEYHKCKVIISSTGNIVASGSNCVFRNYNGLLNAPITGGTIRTSAACAMSGYVTLRYNGSNYRYNLEFGQMSKDKIVFTFTGYRSSNPDIVLSSTAVKQ